MHPGVEDVVFCFLRFPSGLAAHLHMSWLDPHKTRSFTVVGDKQMATFDDMELERKVTVYDKGFDEDAESCGEYMMRSGDIRSPRIGNREPLRIECEHFVECVREGRTPRSDGEAGLRVVRVLDALQRSLDASRSAMPDIHPTAVRLRRHRASATDCEIGAHAVLGKPRRLSPHSTALARGAAAAGDRRRRRDVGAGAVDLRRRDRSATA